MWQESPNKNWGILFVAEFILFSILPFWISFPLGFLPIYIILFYESSSINTKSSHGTWDRDFSPSTQSEEDSNDEEYEEKYPKHEEIRYLTKEKKVTKTKKTRKVKKIQYTFEEVEQAADQPNSPVKRPPKPYDIIRPHTITQKTNHLNFVIPQRTFKRAARLPHATPIPKQLAQEEESRPADRSPAKPDAPIHFPDLKTEPESPATPPNSNIFKFDSKKKEEGPVIVPTANLFDKKVATPTNPPTFNFFDKKEEPSEKTPPRSPLKSTLDPSGPPAFSFEKPEPVPTPTFDLFTKKEAAAPASLPPVAPAAENKASAVETAKVQPKVEEEAEKRETTFDSITYRGPPGAIRYFDQIMRSWKRLDNEIKAIPGLSEKSKKCLSECRTKVFLTVSDSNSYPNIHNMLDDVPANFRPNLYIGAQISDASYEVTVLLIGQLVKECPYLAGVHPINVKFDSKKLMNVSRYFDVFLSMSERALNKDHLGDLVPYCWKLLAWQCNNEPNVFTPRFFSILLTRLGNQLQQTYKNHFASLMEYIIAYRQKYLESFEANSDPHIFRLDQCLTTYKSSGKFEQLQE